MGKVCVCMSADDREDRPLTLCFGTSSSATLGRNPYNNNFVQIQFQTTRYHLVLPFCYCGVPQECDNGPLLL